MWKTVIYCNLLQVIVFLNLFFILSRMDLLNLPILLFAAIISLAFGLLVMFGLSSFRNIKHSSWLFTSTPFATVLSFMMFFPSKLICFPMFLFNFLYVVVIESFSRFLYFSFSSLYRFVVLLTNFSVFLSLLISCMSSFSFLSVLCVSVLF